MEPVLAEKISEIISILDKYKNGDIPFTLTLEDISGNSFIENPRAPEQDPAMTVTLFARTSEQSEQLGITEEMEKQEQGTWAIS